MELGARHDWGFYVEKPRYEPRDYVPSLWDRFKCVFGCWWDHSCYDSEWQVQDDRYRCVCKVGNTIIPYLWRSK